MVRQSNDRRKQAGAPGGGSRVDEPQFKAMFEASAEVLGGLIKAFRDYEQKNEAAWRRAR
jgi:hypothetical protein